MTTTTTPRHPNVRVQLSGRDGNAFAVIGRCRQAAQKAKLPSETIAEFSRQCMASGSYEAMLATCCEWFDCR